MFRIGSPILPAICTPEEFLNDENEGVSYFDCELPRVRRVIEEDPEGFLGGGFSVPLVLDEVHRLANPSEILKIAD